MYGVKLSMAWELEPVPEVQAELDRMGELELRSLMTSVRHWIDAGEWDDLAVARAITDKGHTEEFSYWLLKEVRMRELSDRRAG